MAVDSMQQPRQILLCVASLCFRQQFSGAAPLASKRSVRRGISLFGWFVSLLVRLDSSRVGDGQTLRAG